MKYFIKIASCIGISLSLFGADTPQQTETCQGSLGSFSKFVCEKKGDEFLLQAMPKNERDSSITLTSFLKGSSQAELFVEGLTKAFLDASTIKHYATYAKILEDRLKDVTTEEDKNAIILSFAKEKARANLDLHLKTSSTGVPRFAILKDGQCIGFVRLGNGIIQESVKSIFLNIMEKEALGQLNANGISEPAIVLTPDAQKKGIGSLLIHMFFDSIIPAYTNGFMSHVHFSGGALSAIYFTQSPQNIGSILLKTQIPTAYNVLEAGEVDGKLHFLILLNNR
ncbi:MAG: hypothetical protein KBD31_04680 [Proteobacteria bacterium]|nr:hypothetical protein [Pseudomonadota bacterium]